jgi:hypothetical protein
MLQSRLAAYFADIRMFRLSLMRDQNVIDNQFGGGLSFTRNVSVSTFHPRCSLGPTR